MKKSEYIRKIWIHAPNVHTGGARSLLIEIFSLINSKNYRIILDTRFHLENNYKSLNIQFVKPNIFSRIFVELYLYFKCSKNDTILCFGNLPPLLKKKKVFVINYYQSPFIIQSRSLSFFNLKTKIRIIYERIWIFLCRNHVDLFVVQSDTVLNEIKKYCSQKIITFPFISKRKTYTTSKSSPENRDGFIYVSSGEPHKNHPTLIQAWEELARMDLYPTLKLTLCPRINSSLLEFIANKSIQYNLNIINLGLLHHNDVAKHYLNSQALIFPSKYETFGLPLYEAFELGLPILASEKDFVRDIVKPDQTFDPESSKSIARAVERFILGDNKRNTVYDGTSFLIQLESNFHEVK